MSPVRFFAAIVGGATIVSCSDSRGVAGPMRAGRSAADLSMPAQVSVVMRDTPIADGVSASKLIGPLGGSITLGATGFTLVVPAFALTTPTLITVTAVPGRAVAYEFEPHGTQFLVPALVTQVLEGTSVSGEGLAHAVLFGGYFEDVSAIDQLSATALITELLGTSINPGLGTARFAISHFSGYLLGTGGEGNPGDPGGSQ